MTTESGNTKLMDRIAANAAALRRWYVFAACLLATALILHLGYSAYVFQTQASIDYPRVALFGIVSVCALVVEILLARITFMLASRVGQLFDALYAIDVSRSEIDTLRFESPARILTTLRRQESGLKILDIETAAQHIASAAKPNGAP